MKKTYCITKTDILHVRIQMSILHVWIQILHIDIQISYVRMNILHVYIHRYCTLR